MITKHTILSAIVIAAVLAALGYGMYRRSPQFITWLQGNDSAVTTADAKAPPLPAEPKDADDNVKKLYADANAKHEARVKDPNYVAYMAEGLEWKSIGDYAKTDRNVYYTYAAYVYAEAGKKFPEQWVPWLNVGNMFNLIGEYARAEQAYKKAILIDPTRNEAFSALVDMLFYGRVKPTDDIVKYLNAAFAGITQDQPFAAFTYAKYLLTYQKNAEALAVFTLAHKNVPGDDRLPKEIEALQKVMRGESIEAPPSGNPVIQL